MDVAELLNRMELAIPENDCSSYTKRVEKLDWESIAFENYSAADCKATWTLLLKKIRRFRLLKELITDAKECLLKPKFSIGGKTVSFNIFREFYIYLYIFIRIILFNIHLIFSCIDMWLLYNIFYIFSETKSSQSKEASYEIHAILFAQKTKNFEDSSERRCGKCRY